MQLKLSNLNQPDSARWKRIADYILYTLSPAIIVFLTTVQPVSPEFTIYAIAGTTLLTTLFKGLTKFTNDEPKV